MNRKFSRHLMISALCLFSLSAVASPSRDTTASKSRRSAPAEAMKFTYENFDTPLSYVCKHQLINEANPYDWKVRCFEGPVLRAEYVAHVAFTTYERDVQPAFSVELLYWLTSGTNLPSEVGSTTWLHFSSKSSVVLLTTSQTVEKGTAGLYLEIEPAKAFAK